MPLEKPRPDSGQPPRLEDRGPQRVLVCGSRDFKARMAIETALFELPTGSTVIHGACPTGADEIADDLAERFDHLSVERWPAEWAPGPESRIVRRNRAGEDYDPEAGPRRNRAMLDSGPDLVIAFKRYGALNRGTQDVIDEARRRGIEVREHTV